MDGVLGVAALGVVAHLLPGLLLATHLGAVLHRQVVAVAAGHVVAQRLPADGHLGGLDVHHLEASWAVHGLWVGRRTGSSVSGHQGDQLGHTQRGQMASLYARTQRGSVTRGFHNT